jgi:hypothetical protein
MASLLSNDMVNIIIAFLVMANLALGLFPTSQDNKPNYIPKRLRSKVTSSVSLFSNQIIQSLNPVLNRISNLIICSSTRKYVKSRSRSQTNRQQGHHGNTARYTAKRKLLPQENYRIYQRADLHQFKSKTTDTANTDKSTTSKLHGKFRFISKRLAQLWCMVAINQVAAPSTKQYDRMSHHLHQTDSDSSDRNRQLLFKVHHQLPRRFCIPARKFYDVRARSRCKRRHAKSWNSEMEHT